ncbi:MAG: hypothetical protein HY007_02770 [Candidatus Sungbacteria bacterium]|nr:hypothetical protein [Candidatus Sungbacteria bacterium]
MKRALKKKYPGLYEKLGMGRVFLVRLRASLLRFVSQRYENIINPKTNLLPIDVKVGWSIVIITDGKSNNLLQQAIQSMTRELKGTPFEIIVVGPPRLAREAFMAGVRHVPYRELNLASGWITKKKNMGVALARYDKVVLTHDYLALEPGWKKGFDEFGSDFDVCMNRIINTDGARWKDWIKFDVSTMKFALIPYDAKHTEHQYISGTYFAVKRNFYAENPLDENLRWGEGEDAEWSRRIIPITEFHMNTGSVVKLLRYKPLPPGLEENGQKIKEKPAHQRS